MTATYIADVTGYDIARSTPIRLTAKSITAAKREATRRLEAGRLSHQAIALAEIVDDLMPLAIATRRNAGWQSCV